MQLGLYWKYATRSLIRSGQRTILAIFCIAVGVMAIVALQLVGLSINQALTTNVQQANGGDISVASSSIPLTQADLAKIDALKQSGQITDYATGYLTAGQVTLSDGSVVNPDLIGVSSNFPLVGDATYIAPSSNLNTHTLLTGNHVVVDSGTFVALNAHIGDTFQVKTDDNRVVPVTIAGEYNGTNSNGFASGSMYIAATTLAAIPNTSGAAVTPSFTKFYLTMPSGNVNGVKATLTSEFPLATITTTQDLLKQRQTQVNQIRLFLQIVGLLALFIGGIGIVNTMQVLLRRRRVEIAMLKTAGYSQRNLYGFFGLEAALLGLMGGIVGTLLALLATNVVRGAVENAFQVQLPLIIDGFTIGSGVAIGFFTALIFGILPIVQASQIRPLAVLRESDEGTNSASFLLTGTLLVLLLALFVGLATTIIGTFLTALLVVLGGVIILGALAAGFGLLVLAISKLPIYERPSPKILLWILAAFGGIFGAGIAFGILFVLGRVLGTIGAQVGGVFANFVSYAQIGLTGLGIILFGGAGVFFLATLIDAIVMFLPNSWKTAVMLAYRNMGRQRIRTTITLTALFVGVFAIGIVVLVGQGITSAINSFASTTLQYNLTVSVPVSQRDALAAQIPTLPGLQNNHYVENTVASHLVPVSINGVDIQTALGGLPTTGSNRNQKQEYLFFLSGLQGFNLASGQTGDLPDPTLIDSGRNLTAADAGTNNVVLYNQLAKAPLNLQPGATIVVKNLQGQAETLNVVGFWKFAVSSTTSTQSFIFADTGVVQTLGGAQTQDVFSLKVDAAKVILLRKQLSTTLPAATVMSLADFTSLIDQILNGLISMLSTIASLALIAGLIIIANAVALAMLERRREIGILKSVGHTSGSVLATVLIENGLVGGLGALVAMLLVGSVLGILTLSTGINFGFNLPIITLIIASSAIVTMAISALVAWSATRVRPLEVLRYE
jgi:predicted lysophospholipase L1 biosynthesis ABC-type transport system permease subunit